MPTLQTHVFLMVILLCDVETRDVTAMHGATLCLTIQASNTPLGGGGQMKLEEETGTFYISWQSDELTNKKGQVSILFG
jgi:hypothetical protein